MKNVLTSITAILLAVWYSLSVIGFDVHTCSGSGETYIATVASGFSCSDIHPGHGHSGCRCCHSDEAAEDAGGMSLDRKPCCTDDFHFIALTGVKSSDDERGAYLMCCHFMPCVQTTDFQPIVSYPGLSACSKACCGGIPPRDIQASYNIWRI